MDDKVKELCSKEISIPCAYQQVDGSLDICTSSYNLLYALKVVKRMGSDAPLSELLQLLRTDILSHIDTKTGTVLLKERLLTGTQNFIVKDDDLLTIVEKLEFQGLIEKDGDSFHMTKKGKEAYGKLVLFSENSINN